LTLSSLAGPDWNQMITFDQDHAGPSDNKILEQPQTPSSPTPEESTATRSPTGSWSYHTTLQAPPYICT